MNERRCLIRNVSPDLTEAVRLEDLSLSAFHLCREHPALLGPPAKELVYYASRGRVLAGSLS